MLLSARLRMLVCLCASTFAFAGSAGERKATEAEAIAMVKKAVATIRKAGRDKTYVRITDRHGEFVMHDLYVTVWGLDGTVRAHGLNANMVGKNLIDLKDIDGRPFIRERFELARTKPAFWQDYQYTHPETRRIEPKRMYCERLDDSVVCAGVYR